MSASQPIQGWMGHADPFAVGPGYQAHQGIQAFLTGTPPILAMVPLRGGIAMLAEAGIRNVQAKSLGLTDFAQQLIDEWLIPLGVRLASPRECAPRRPRHDLYHRVRPGQQPAVGARRDSRPPGPDGIRLGLVPLSTTYAEVATAVSEVRDILSTTPDG